LPKRNWPEGNFHETEGQRASERKREGGIPGLMGKNDYFYRKKRRRFLPKGAEKGASSLSKALYFLEKRGPYQLPTRRKKRGKKIPSGGKKKKNNQFHPKGRTRGHDTGKKKGFPSSWASGEKVELSSIGGEAREKKRASGLSE